MKQTNKFQNSCEAGYVALASVLVIAAVVLVIGISVSLLSVNEAQSALSGRRNEETIHLVEGCVEDALLRLNRQGSIPATISLPQGDCSVTINSQIGDDWDITVTLSVEGFSKSFRIMVTRGVQIIITSWQEE